jgi:hypothetical protein
MYYVRMFFCKNIKRAFYISKHNNSNLYISDFENNITFFSTMSDAKDAMKEVLKRHLETLLEFPIEEIPLGMLHSWDILLKRDYKKSSDISLIEDFSNKLVEVLIELKPDICEKCWDNRFYRQWMNTVNKIGNINLDLGVIQKINNEIDIDEEFNKIK